MICTVFGEVVLSEPFPYFVGRDADNRVPAGVEILRKLKQFHTDGAFFESAVRAVYRVLDDVLEKLPASLAGGKCGAIHRRVSSAITSRSRDSLSSVPSASTICCVGIIAQFLV